MSRYAAEESRVVRFVSPEHVAALTPFEPVTIRRACARGEIPGAVKKAGRWCIPEGAERIWLEQGDGMNPAPSVNEPAREPGPKRFRDLIEAGP